MGAAFPWRGHVPGVLRSGFVPPRGSLGEGEIASDRLEDCEATAVGYRGWAGEGDVSTEIHSRDEGWLEGGGEPAASFETASLEEEIRRRRPQGAAHGRATRASWRARRFRD